MEKRKDTTKVKIDRRLEKILMLEAQVNRFAKTPNQVRENKVIKAKIAKLHKEIDNLDPVFYVKIAAD